MSLSTNVQNLALRVATEAKALRTLVNGNVADLGALNTAAKSNLVAAINEVAAAVAVASGIDDTTTSSTTAWSSSKTEAEIDAAVAALVGAAPETMDTLQELAAALGEDEAFSTSVLTALGQRVRVDAAQTFTAPQQSQARANIAAASTSEVEALSTAVGDTTTNFVTVFENGLA